MTKKPGIPFALLLHPPQEQISPKIKQNKQTKTELFEEAEDGLCLMKMSKNGGTLDNPPTLTFVIDHCDELGGGFFFLKRSMAMVKRANGALEGGG